VRVALRIERLVFDGVELTQRERAARAGARVERLGAQIADAVYDRVPRAGGRR
jgi:hypothetical protein